jgi:hypothetical protein
METLSLAAHGGPCARFGSSDMIIDLGSPDVFQQTPRSLGKGFAGALHSPNADLFRINPHFSCCLSQVQAVGGGVERGGCADIYHFVDAPPGVEGAARDHLAAKLFGRIMPLPEGYIDIVSKGDKDPVRLTKSGHPEDVTPDLNTPLPAFVALRNIDRFPCGAGCLPIIAHLRQIDAQKISVEVFPFTLLGQAEIFLIGERQPPQVFPGLNILRFNAVQLLPVKGRMALGVPHVLSKVPELDLQEPFPLQGFHPRIPIFPAFPQHSSRPSTVLILSTQGCLIKTAIPPGSTPVLL